MRFFLTLLFTVLIPLNAAYAAVVGMCDAMEHTQSEVAHFGHHSHGQGDDHAHAAHDGSPADPGQPSQSSAASDHQHAHVHPVFSTLLSGTIDVMPIGGRTPYAALDHRDFVSAPQLRLDRPPRAALA